MPLSRRRVLQIVGRDRRGRRGRMGIVRRHARQRLLSRALSRTISTACGSSTPAAGPATAGVPALAALRSRRVMAGELPEPVRRRPAARADRRRCGARDPHRPREPAAADARAKHPHRSRVGRSRQPLLLRRTQAGESAGHRLRRPAEDRRRAGDAQPLRPHGRRHHRPAVAALPPAHRHAARQRYDPERRPCRTSSPTPWTGMRRSTSATACRARRADAALVGARHRRSQPRAVGELRRCRRAPRRSIASATAASATAPRSSACAGAIPASRWRCCRSAPTSRAGSCAIPT